MLFGGNGRQDTIVIGGARVVDPALGIDAAFDVTVERGVITALEPTAETQPGLVLAPAFVDPHVHLRTPGREDEETNASGTAAAAAGGYCAILAMPNTEPVVDSAARPGRAVIDGRERLLLCTNDYLGLAADERVVAAAGEALAQFGVGSRAARSLAGDTDLHRALEHELAEFKGTEAALLFGSGFACNVGVIAALTTADDVICSDALNHASIVDGCRLSPARTRVYGHGDLDELEAILRDSSSASKRMIVTDAVFSMDGDVAPLREIVGLAGRYEAFVMLDEAHATGVLGPRGEGTLEQLDLVGEVPVLMGTLGKALGSVGGFVAGSRDLVDLLAGTARSFLFTTSLPAAAAAAALTSLRILRAEPERVERLWDNARRLHAGLAELGFRVASAPAPILPVFLDDDRAGAQLSKRLYERGVVVQPVGAPYVPRGTSRLRVIASAAHSDDDVEAVLAAFAQARA